LVFFAREFMCKTASRNLYNGQMAKHHAVEGIHSHPFRTHKHGIDNVFTKTIVYPKDSAKPPFTVHPSFNICSHVVSIRYDINRWRIASLDRGRVAASEKPFHGGRSPLEGLYELLTVLSIAELVQGVHNNVDFLKVL
jgi:hypothetical protein